MENPPPKLHKTGYDWVELHKYYMFIKEQYNLSSYDMVRQLSVHANIPYYHRCTQYLSNSGHQRTPATKPGTVGRRIRDLLISGISPVVKTVWSTSTSTYEEKLFDKKHNGWYYNYHVHVIKDVKITSVESPEISVCYMNEHYMIPDRNQPTKEELVRLFTIDGIVPVVVEISQGYYL